MKDIKKVVLYSFAVWGVLAFVGILFIGFGMYRQFSSRSGSVSNHDVRFVLNWCGLGDERTEEVLHSYESARHMTGDHLDAYAIRISHVSVEELLIEDDHYDWYRCDQVTGVLDDALDFVGAWLPSDEVPWFLSEEDIRSDRVYLYSWSIYCNGIRPTSVKFIFVKPEEKMVYYISCET